MIYIYNETLGYHFQLSVGLIEKKVVLNKNIYTHTYVYMYKTINTTIYIP